MVQMKVSFYASEHLQRDRLEAMGLTGDKLKAALAKITEAMLTFDVNAETGEVRHWPKVSQELYKKIAELEAELAVVKSSKIEQQQTLIIGLQDQLEQRVKQLDDARKQIGNLAFERDELKDRLNWDAPRSSQTDLTNQLRCDNDRLHAYSAKLEVELQKVKEQRDEYCEQMNTLRNELQQRVLASLEFPDIPGREPQKEYGIHGPKCRVVHAKVVDCCEYAPQHPPTRYIVTLEWDRFYMRVYSSQEYARGATVILPIPEGLDPYAMYSDPSLDWQIDANGVVQPIAKEPPRRAYAAATHCVYQKKGDLNFYLCTVEEMQKAREYGARLFCSFV